MDRDERIPRMRTAPKIVAEIKALDPDTEVTEHYIRRLVKDGTVPVTWAGNKALINLNDVLDLLRGSQYGGTYNTPLRRGCMKPLPRTESAAP